MKTTYLKCHHGNLIKDGCKECYNEKHAIYTLVHTTHENKDRELIPIYRGCDASKHGGCFCTGKCREIIGYQEPEVTTKCQELEDSERYSKKPFYGYRYRFVVQFETGDPYFHILHIYSNSESLSKLEDYINRKKSDKVISFKIVHQATKEEDEKTDELLLKGI